MATINDKKYIKDSDLSHFGKALLNKQIQKTTWSNLKDARDSSILIPGCVYRITDYYCTTKVNSSRSAGHRFDILVEAINTNTLSEVCKCCKHEFADDEVNPFTGQLYTQEEKDYFNNVNINAWVVWYNIDSDYKYTWALGDSIFIDFALDGSTTLLTRRPDYDKYDKYAWGNYPYPQYTPGSGATYPDWYYTTSEIPTIGDTFELIRTTTDVVLSTHTATKADVLPEAHGVIYRMIDDYGCDCTYDFKNIQFMIDDDWRATYDGYYNTSSYGTTGVMWFYTFSKNTSNIITDLSLKGNYTHNIRILNNNVLRRIIQVGGAAKNSIFADCYEIFLWGTQLVDSNLYRCNNVLASGIKNSNFEYVEKCVFNWTTSGGYNTLNNVTNSTMATKYVSGSTTNTSRRVLNSRFTDCSYLNIPTGTTGIELTGCRNINISSDSTRAAPMNLFCDCKMLGFFSYLNIHFSDYVYSVYFMGSIEGTSTTYKTIELGNPSNSATFVDVDSSDNVRIYKPTDLVPETITVTPPVATPTVVNITMMSGKCYSIPTAITELTITFAHSDLSNHIEHHVMFTAGANMTLTMPSGIIWANNTPPPRTQGKTYEIHVFNEKYATYLEY